MPAAAELWQQRQREASTLTVAAVLRLWAQFRLTDPQRSFQALLPGLLAALTSGQVVAATGASRYVAAVVLADGLAPDPVAAVAPQRFAGVTSDGRTPVGLLTQPLLRSLYLRTSGADDATALAGGRLSLETLVRTEVLDTGRDAVSVAAALDRRVVGYERYVNLPACGRCILLAGRVYSRSTGFARHPRCDCSHRILTDRSARDGTEQDPRGLFDGMTREQQARAFGKDNAEVIRRGGDISQVVNARRGMATAGSNWTTEGATRRRGQGARPAPAQVLRVAGDDPDRFAQALADAGYL